jgi:hypothetical protein
MLSASASKLDMSENADVVDDGGSRVDVTTPAPAATTAGTVGSGRSTTTTYRYSKKKTPVVHLEKLNIVTDSNGMKAFTHLILMILMRRVHHLIQFLWYITLTNFTFAFPTQISHLVKC